MPGIRDFLPPPPWKGPPAPGILLPTRNWQDEFPLVRELNRAWGGCAWAEPLPPGVSEPLGPPPTLENLDEWMKERNLRMIRIWRRAERYFEQHPDEYQRLLQLGIKYKRRGWLKWV